jgi:hypothetical protein
VRHHDQGALKVLKVIQSHCYESQDKESPLWLCAALALVSRRHAGLKVRAVSGRARAA